ncbi:Phosphoribosylglycinamide formyltransferase [Desulfonema limicola]|uniref:Phosphoribosylglycinamide formyltransferase n=1 Tax=Desulfonema limicola TaxID=45656 RepID=A0A975GF99_9BACT|nr:phosphoribosylglycinamide formyltransferase [Desulfonema limicola]QTA78975.1 Phosphoribosylglycinamide formyltransferase [Desulfonema limicola]
MSAKIKIGALISGGGTNLQAIIDSCESGKIDGEMVFVGTDNPEAKGLKRADRHNIPYFAVNYAQIIKQYKQNPENIILPDDFDLNEAIEKQNFFSPDYCYEKIKNFLLTRASAEARLLEKINLYDFDLLVLAGFMRNLTPYFIDKINTDHENPCIMNIHPALLPAFPGVDGYGDTFRYGCRVGGCTVHFIDYGEDSGPIIGQKSFYIEKNDTLDDVKIKGLEKEWELYPECIQLFAQNRLKTKKMSYTLDNNTFFNRTIVLIK